MTPKFLLNDVVLRKTNTPRDVDNPLYATNCWQINQQEFAMQIDGIGRFYACNGKEVDYSPDKGATKESLELYLNGSIYGAILHQRYILPMHGSSFIWNEEGILLCGESGAGKSSLTAAFCFAGAEFLTDDVTPLVFEGHKPVIVPLSDRIKLWNDSLFQLNQDNSNLHAIYPGEEKYYLPMQIGQHNKYPLHRMFLIEVGESDKIIIEKIKGVKLFTALRNEIYRWEYLSAMPETEISYVEKLLAVTQTVNVYKIYRPIDVAIEAMTDFIRRHLEESKVMTDEDAPKVI